MLTAITSESDINGMIKFYRLHMLFIV